MKGSDDGSVNAVYWPQYPSFGLAGVANVDDFDQHLIAMHGRADRVWRNKNIAGEFPFEVGRSRSKIWNNEAESISMKAQFSGDQIFTSSSGSLRNCVSVRIHFYQLAGGNHFLQSPGKLFSLIAMQS